MKAKRTIHPEAGHCWLAIAGYRVGRRYGDSIERVIAVDQAGWSGFWRARRLIRHGVEERIVSSLPACRSIVGCVAQSLTVSMRSRCFGHCSSGHAGEPRVLEWRRRFRLGRGGCPKMRSRTNRTHLQRVGLDRRVRDCSGDAWRDRLQPIAPKPMSSSGRIVDWSPAKAADLQTRMPGSSVCLLGWSWCLCRSLNWSVSVMR